MIKSIKLFFLFIVSYLDCVEMIITSCSQPLKANPFITYRDPITGKWIVVNPNLPKVDQQMQRAAA